MRRGKTGFTIDIADIPMLFELPQPLADGARRRYGSFLSARPAQLSFRLEPWQREPPDDESEVDLQPTEGDRRYRPLRWDFDCLMDLGTGEVTGKIAPSPVSLDVLLRVVLSLVLARSKGFLIHACGVLHGGRSILFYGVSGSGKSTVARSSQGGTLLSEEIVAVRRRGDGVEAYGTPFSGEFRLPGAAVSAPVAAFLSLVKSPRPKLARIEPSIAARRLLRSVLYFGGTRADADALLETCLVVANNAPCFEFRLDLKSPFWEQLNGLG